MSEILALKKLMTKPSLTPLGPGFHPINLNCSFLFFCFLNLSPFLNSTVAAPPMVLTVTTEGHVYAEEGLYCCSYPQEAALVQVTFIPEWNTCARFFHWYSHIRVTTHTKPLSS